MTKTHPTIGLMLDIETLSLKADAAVWQLALVGFPMDDPTERLQPSVNHFLPVQAQLEFVPPSRIDFKTLLFTVRQQHALANLTHCDSEDFEELPSLLRHTTRAFERMITDPATGKRLEYELIARRPQFDIPIVERLYRMCGLFVPWSYDRIIDLATLMDYADVKPGDVPTPEGYVKHDAFWDCEHQIACYAEAVKGLRSR